MMDLDLRQSEIRAETTEAQVPPTKRDVRSKTKYSGTHSNALFGTLQLDGYTFMAGFFPVDVMFFSKNLELRPSPSANGVMSLFLNRASLSEGGRAKPNEGGSILLKELSAFV